MKVICVDNYNRDYHPDRLITVSIDEDSANLIASTLNAREGENSPNYYKVVEDEYKLNYEDIYDENGEKMSFDKYINSRGYKVLPLSIQHELYNLYIKD